MPKQDLQTNIRLPASLKDKITEAAQLSGRTFTAELVWRLKSSFGSSATFMLIDRRTTEFMTLRDRYEQLELEEETLRGRLAELDGEKSAAATSERKILQKAAERIAEERAVMQTQLQRINDELTHLLDELVVRAKKALEM